MERGNEWDRVIVKKGRLYVRSCPTRKLFAKHYNPELTPSAWDAKPMTRGVAAMVARNIGGKVCALDMLKGVVI